MWGLAWFQSCPKHEISFFNIRKIRRKKKKAIKKNSKEIKKTPKTQRVATFHKSFSSQKISEERLASNFELDLYYGLIT